MSVAGLVIGLGLIVIAGVVAIDVMGMRVPPVHSKVGPRFFPLVVSCALALAGAAVVRQSWRGTFEAEEQAATDWRAVATIAAGLVAHMNLMKPAGFVVAAFVLFLSVTVAFGSRRYLRDGIVALILSLAAYLAFTRLLGLQLPAGLLQGII
jgi:putative tricarboxylic transport membrane protein